MTPLPLFTVAIYICVLWQIRSGKFFSLHQLAREVVTGLLTWTRVATTGHNDAVQALQLPMADFEDALQVSAAQACGADYIITRNGRDFVKSPLPALSPEEFLARHPVK